MKTDWCTNDFDYVLSEGLIAQRPLPNRWASRLMSLNKTTGILEHKQVMNWLEMLRPEDLLIFNDTKVIPARLFGVKKASGGKVECLIERVLGKDRSWAHLRASKKPKIGAVLRLAGTFDATIIDQQDNLYLLEIDSHQSFTELLGMYGEVPLPPYIRRQAEKADQERYQTVFARNEGAVAAPTAGLHFDEDFFTKLSQRKIPHEFVTLHIGAGTFQPVRVEQLEHHHMHDEYMELSSSVCEAIKQCRLRGGRVIAVGTTVVRCLESVAQMGELKPYCGKTRLFIYPGFQFRCVDAIFTNFHLPKSSLLMLVCAFGGYDFMMRAYREAVDAQYRFFSYGDAMFIFGNTIPI